jgi:hypothetical protein
MSLQSWLNNGWLRAHKTSPQEIQDLLEIVDRDLKDARGGISAVLYLRTAHFWQNFSSLFSLFAPVQDLWLRLAALRTGDSGLRITRL